MTWLPAIRYALLGLARILGHFLIYKNTLKLTNYNLGLGRHIRGFNNGGNYKNNFFGLCRHRVDTNDIGACWAGHCFSGSRVRITSQRALGAQTRADSWRRRILQFRGDSSKEVRRVRWERSSARRQPLSRGWRSRLAGGVSLNISAVRGLTQDSGALNPKINQFVDYLSYLIPPLL